VLVDEVLSVGDAAFRRRALEALRGLIADGKTVLFISHDMWNVRRLCSDILWMENGGVRAYGAAGEIAERYMNEVNLEAMANQATSLQSHRGGTGEVRYVAVDLHTASGEQTGLITPGESLVVRATYRANQRLAGPVFQVAIVDVDSGLVITTATSKAGDVPAMVDGDWRDRMPFDRLPLRPRQYVLRLAITDAHQLASYDVVTAGPRFAVTGLGGGVENLADEEDGLVSLPLRVRSSRGRAGLTTTVIVSVPHGGAAGNILRTGILSRVLDADRSLKVVLASPLVNDAGFVREFTHPRISSRRTATAPAGRPRGAAAGADAGRLSRVGCHRIGEESAAPKPPRKGVVRWLPLKKPSRQWWRRRCCVHRLVTISAIGWSRILRRSNSLTGISPRCWWFRTLD
jgi:hypothetical protein